MLAVGRFEFVGANGTYQGQRGDNDLIFELVSLPGGNKQYRKVTLPQTEFPDLYAMKRESLWLDNRADELERKRSRDQ